MALVGYSDSEGPGDESPKLSQKTPSGDKPGSTRKSNFQKFTSSAKTIKVNLPTASIAQDNTNEDGEPAPKRAKMSGSGFNAMLPAPKRPKPGLASGARGKGLGSGINLKTGAAPGFSREMPESKEEEEPDFQEEPPTNGSAEPDQESIMEEKTPVAESSKKSAMIFKPLSVSRKPKKKSAAAQAKAQTTSQNSAVTEQAVKPKTSLFSTPIVDELGTEPTSAEYYPMMGNVLSTSNDGLDLSAEPPEPIYNDIPPQTEHAPQAAESLSSLATSLNLTASQRRQLLGRKGANLVDAKVLEYNTEKEYAANEELRARGETVSFNPIRSVTSGKASLQSMVNLVANQKDALEESFAAGRRNKKEAGAKYGW